MSRQLVGKDATRWWQSPNNVLMRCSEIEEGSLITSSLISKSEASITSYDSNDQLQNDKQYSPDPVTLRVIFSSLVAACGSYVYGHAAKVGQMKEFEASLQSLRGLNVDISQEAAEIKDYTNFLQQISGDAIMNLFQRKYIHSLIFGVGLIVFQRFGGVYAFLFYAGTIFESAGFSSSIGSITAAIVQIITTTLGAVLVDVSGRRLMLLISTVGACLGCIITALAFVFEELSYSTEISGMLVLIGVVVYLGFLQLGLGGIPWIIMSEIFPINIKGSAGSLAILVSWIGSWVVSYTFNTLFDWSSIGTFFLYGAICGLGVLFIWKLVPETKGRTLEENSSINDEWSPLLKKK